MQRISIEVMILGVNSIKCSFQLYIMAMYIVLSDEERATRTNYPLYFEKHPFEVVEMMN